MGRYPRTSPEDIAAEIIRDNPPHEPKHYEFVGATFVGDVWYSGIQSRIRSHWGKKYPYEVFGKVCDILRNKGYWVHS